MVITHGIEVFFKSYLLIPVCVSLLILIIFILLNYIKNKNYSLKNKKVILKNTVIFISLIYFSVILYITLFSRINTFETDSLSRVYDGWLIKESKYYFDFNPIYNMIMFAPLCSIIFTLKKIFTPEYTLNNKKVIIISTISAFALSFLIEISQLIFTLGTFQFSDLFYNTLGGFLGAIIYNFIIKKRNSTKQN